jgi:uncharacterized membrane protein YagU involved in acid resistance
MMNWSSWFIWGFAATVVLTTISALSQGLGLTRMNLPYMLGTIFTPDRDKARAYGLGVHFLSGWVFSLVYVLLFQKLGAAGWWRGAIIGLVHAMFVLVVVVALLPGFHSRMAGEQHGPDAHNMLEPPGFMALNYGIRTPISVLFSHFVFGAILGAFYQLR